VEHKRRGIHVKNAFLHGNLEKEAYVEIRLGLQDSSVNGKVPKLKKGTVWFKTIS
jgi:hypothetical protein